MYRLIRVYQDGVIVEGKVLYSEFDIDKLAILICQLKTVTYEFAIALEIE